MKQLLLLIVSMAVPVLFAQTPPPTGRYFTPATLYDSLKGKSTTVSNPTEREAQFYLMGVYDLSQETGQSCAMRGTTSAAQLEHVYTSYIEAHPIPRNTLVTHAQLQKQTAASVAMRAFSEAWPCQSV
jgi:Rap1a immunity proteins